MLSATNYAQNYAGIIGKALLISIEASLLQSAVYIIGANQLAKAAYRLLSCVPVAISVMSALTQQNQLPQNYKL